MSKQSQIAWVEAQLRAFGNIGRNQCLRTYITRLSAIICNLQKDGYVFETERVSTVSLWGAGYDYIYRVISQPSDPIHYND